MNDTAKAILIIGGAGLGLYLLTKLKPTVPPVPPEKTGTIRITSEPSGANIKLDSIEGRTPFTRTLPVGTYYLIVSKDGYYSKTMAVDVLKEQLTTYHIELQPIVRKKIMLVTYASTEDYNYARTVSQQLRGIYEIFVWRGASLSNIENSDIAVIIGGQYAWESVSTNLFRALGFTDITPEDKGYIYIQYKRYRNTDVYALAGWTAEDTQYTVNRFIEDARDGDIARRTIKTKYLYEFKIGL